jgi:hypothetical protein
MPVRQIATTFPAYGIVIEMAASASAVGLMDLVLNTVERKSTPTPLALQFLPEFGARPAAQSTTDAEGDG